MILKHMRTDPNAESHMTLGCIGSVALASLTYALTSNVMESLLGFILGGFLIGLGIEAVQRIQRIGLEQNTLKESALDVGVTGCWFLWPFR